MITQDELDSEVIIVLGAGWIRNTIGRLIGGGNNPLELPVTARYSKLYGITQ